MIVNCIYLCRLRSPLPEFVRIPHAAGYPILSNPHIFKVPIQSPGLNYSKLQRETSYLSFAPPEVIGTPNILLVMWLLFYYLIEIYFFL